MLCKGSALCRHSRPTTGRSILQPGCNKHTSKTQNTRQVNTVPLMQSDTGEPQGQNETRPRHARQAGITQQVWGGCCQTRAFPSTRELPLRAEQSSEVSSLAGRTGRRGRPEGGYQWSWRKQPRCSQPGSHSPPVRTGAEPQQLPAPAQSRAVGLSPRVRNVTVPHTGPAQS